MSYRKLIDEEFTNVGLKEGLEIWRIENFKLVKLNPKDFGKELLN